MFVNLRTLKLSNAMTAKEDKITTSVIEQLELNDLSLTWQSAVNGHADSGIDGFFELANYDITFKASIKQTIRQHQIAYLKALKEHIGDAFILFAENIPPALQLELRKNGINYADAFGNMSIKYPQPLLSIYHSGQKGTVSKSADPKLTPKMAIFLLYLLEHKEELNNTVRQLSEITKTSNDTIQKTKDWLKSKAFIISKSPNEYVWDNWKAAYQRWLTAYEEDLRPKHFMKAYDWLNPDDVRKPLEAGQYWTGEVVLMLQQLGLANAGLFELYTQGSTLNLMKQLRLKPNPDGRVKVYQQFWTWPDGNTISPLIIYADLLLNRDARIQTLSKAYENEYISRYY